MTDDIRRTYSDRKKLYSDNHDIRYISTKDDAFLISLHGMKGLNIIHIVTSDFCDVGYRKA